MVAHALAAKVLNSLSVFFVLRVRVRGEVRLGGCVVVRPCLAHSRLMGIRRDASSDVWHTMCHHDNLRLSPTLMQVL